MIDNAMHQAKPKQIDELEGGRNDAGQQSWCERHVYGSWQPTYI